MAEWEMCIMHGERHAVQQCITCGVFYTIPLKVHEHHFNDGGYSFCPNGHQTGWRTGEEKRQQDALRLERDRLKQREAQLSDEIAVQHRRTEKLEKELLTAKRRAIAGVCPCCNRMFSNVQRHMLSKHKNVVPLAQKTAK